MSAVNTDTDTILEALNDKADRDAGNFDAIGKTTIVGFGMPDYESATQYINSAPAEYTATQDCYVCCKGANLVFDLYKGSTRIFQEFLYSANYTSVWAFLPKGYTITRIAVSEYHNLIIAPLKGINN